ncbi:PREDICTED: uncharacterized protein LOC104588854 isoform X1 [Nelumbo nucifera]|uniref:Uncharacterized protein LOC104588854 isoform X1 n=2 Tax=Nelumbo nucifera TaxID=4432 RepID=A0A1U7ZBP7_NELNU|nr:PREDICTED: uncharacterized protein LOC104588854 isoform X1 [Nelumbo nucifera]DAD48519.1 TPA_asm: hypothetical protein HUJ06_018456 [Nelumbo nucifera]
MDSPKVRAVELNLISAQGLNSGRWWKGMKTYAVSWINPTQKLRSRIDTVGRSNPTWNDKFIFVMDGERDLGNSTSALEIEIYTVRRFWKDQCIGVVSIPLDNLMKGGFMAIELHHPSSGAVEGILNVGVTMLDNVQFFVKSSVPVDYRALLMMGVKQKKNEDGERKEEGVPVLLRLGTKKLFYGFIPSYMIASSD